MDPRSRDFKANAAKALDNATLQKALGKFPSGFPARRAEAISRLPEFDTLRDAARDIKNHTLENLDVYLEAFEAKATAAGGHVHWCEDAEAARQTVLKICRDAGARTVTKGKSMVAEEIGLNDFLEKHAIEPVETDLGEYIIQLRGEPPSHIIVPAVHVTKPEIEETFRKAHTDLDPDRPLEDADALTNEARTKLRSRYFEADVGITGANFLVAETGSSIIVTNEGNGDLTQSLARVHIVVASLEKVVPTLEDASTILRLLARSSTGQEFSVYTTLSTGPRREGDAHGPEEYHVILLDNGRSEMLGGEFQDMLRCIRCAACMNHCPVYGAVGGHAYGWVYPGPMGAVLTPTLIGVHEAGHLPNASTFCGRCEAVCPMRIPLPRMMRAYRRQEFEGGMAPPAARFGLGVWGFLARRPKLYGWATGLASRALSLMAGRKGRLKSVPLAGGWTSVRDLPAPEGGTFRARYAAARKAGGGAP